MSTKPILHSVGYALGYLCEQIADVPQGDMVAQPNGIANHPAWVIGHLTHSCEQLGGVIGVPAWLPANCATCFGTGSVPVADSSLYEKKDEALARLRDAQERPYREPHGRSEQPARRAMRKSGSCARSSGSMRGNSINPFPIRRTSRSSRPSATR